MLWGPRSVPSPRSRRRIVVVHVGRRMSRGVFRALEVEHDIFEAQGLRRGLALLRAQTGRVDLVVVMGLTQASGTPYVAGVSLLTDIFRHWPWIPVLVFAHPGPHTGLRADVLMSGVRAVLPHPAPGPTLKRAIRGILSRAPRRDPRHGATAMKRVRAFLDEHDDSRCRLPDLARRAGLSRSYFSTRFHAVLGMSLREYRRTRRLARAHHLMMTTTLSLAAVAAEAGFYDLPHFDKAFRGRLGMTPREFRGPLAARR
jgi:AraC-like DNA-binding protein